MADHLLVRANPYNNNEALDKTYFLKHCENCRMHRKSPRTALLSPFPHLSKLKQNHELKPEVEIVGRKKCQR
jgi:hypothetical protein